MGEIKTKPTEQDVDMYLSQLEPESRRSDAAELKAIFDGTVNEKACLWNNNMIGYGSYHYKSDRSTQEGDWPLTAFSVRKQYIAVYIMSGVKKYKDLTDKLGKIKISSGSCIYINKLRDIDIDVLKKIIAESVADMKKTYPS